MIQDKKYREAQKLLRKIDHPIAKIWLEKLDQHIQTEQPNKGSSSAKTIFTLGAICTTLLIGFVGGWLLMPKLDAITEVAIVVPSPTETPAATATPFATVTLPSVPHYLRLFRPTRLIKNWRAKKMGIAHVLQP